MNLRSLKNKCIDLLPIRVRHWYRMMLVQKSLLSTTSYHCHKDFEGKGTIVFFSDGRLMNTGLADKLRGIISLYQYAKYNKYPFRIYWNYPFELSDYLVPADVNWQVIDISDISDENSYPIVIESYYKSLNLQQKQEANNQHLFFKYQLCFNKAKQYQVYTNAHWGINQYRTLFFELFKLHPRLESKLEKVMPYEEYVAMQFRFRQLLGDFVDSAGGEILGEEERAIYIKNSIEEIKLIYRKHNCKILITTDSNCFLNEVKTLPFVLIVPGEISHSGIKSDFVSHYDKEFLDLFMLSRSIKIYQMHKDKMYYSGFPEAASLIGNVPLEIIEY